MPSKFITPDMTLVNQWNVFKLLASFSSFAALMAYALVRSLFFQYPLPVADEVMLIARFFGASSLISVLLFSVFLLLHFIYKNWISVIAAKLLRGSLWLYARFSNYTGRQIVLATGKIGGYKKEAMTGVQKCSA